MAQLINRRYAIRVAQVCFVLGCLLTCGCSESKSVADVSGQPYVRVIHQGQPLGDIQVRLHESQGGPVLAQSISRQDGKAHFAEVPSPEPSNYFVTVESISDGGWILDAKACKKLSQNTSLEAFESSREQRIEIPNGAVRPLSFSRRR